MHQLENGYTRIADSLLDAILVADFSKRELVLLLAVIRFTYGYSRKSHLLTASFLSTATGLRRQHVATTISTMVQRGILTSKRTSAGNVLALRKAFFPSPKTGSTPSPKTGSTLAGDMSQNRVKGSPKTGSTPSPKTGHKIDKLIDRSKDNNAHTFLTFWCAYPRKTNRKRAESAWRNLTKADRVAAQQGLATYQFGDDPNFMPHASTWLNGRRWEDQPLPQKRNGNGQHPPRRETQSERFWREQHEILARPGPGDGGTHDGVVVDVHGRVVRDEPLE